MSEQRPAQTQVNYLQQKEYGQLIALFNARRLVELKRKARILVAQRPDWGLVWKTLGSCLTVQGKDGVFALRIAANLLPVDAEAYGNLGIALKTLGRHAEAAACYRQALTISTDYPEAHYNLGITLSGLGRQNDAAASYRRALVIRPNYAEAHCNLGNVLKDLGHQDDATASYRHAIEIQPDHANAYYNLGIAFGDLGRANEAATSYRRALAIKPASVAARLALVMLTLPITPRTTSEAADAPAKFDAALFNMSQWIRNLGHSADKHGEMVLQPPFRLAYRNENHVARLSQYGDLVTGCIRRNRHLSREPLPRVRLAVLSSHFRRHSVWDIILRGLLMNLDRNRFEVFLYHVGYQEDEETDLARSLADVWRDSHRVRGFNGWLKAIAEDHPDVIFYPAIGMDSLTLRFASCRLAPLQIVSWGHPVTSGLPTIDSYFSGELIEPDDAQSHYREQLVRLPGTGCCTTPAEFLPEPLHELEAELNSRRGACFLLAQMPFKFDPADDPLYARIAAAVGDCTFIMMRAEKYPWASDLVHSRLSRAFLDLGLDPERHLVVVPWLSREKFHSLLDLSDVFLDCPSFSGYTTAWQAIHRGLPVVTAEGRFMRQRLAAGLLRKIGLTGTIASSADDYVQIAIRLATECLDQNRYMSTREAIRAVAPSMDNDISVVRAFEKNLMDQLAERRCLYSSGEPGMNVQQYSDGLA